MISALVTVGVFVFGLLADLIGFIDQIFRDQLFLSVNKSSNFEGYTESTFFDLETKKKNVSTKLVLKFVDWKSKKSKVKLLFQDLSSVSKN